MLLALLIALLAAPAKPDLESLLAAPASPGAMVALIEHAQDTRVGTTWERCLGDPKAEVRAAAARAVHVAGASGLASALAQALAKETDAFAAREEIRALALLGDEKQVLAIVDAAKRLDEETQGIASLAIGRRLGLRAFTVVPGFWDLSFDRDADGLIETVSRGELQTLKQMLPLAIGRSRAELLRPLLSRLREARVAVDPGLLRGALESSAPEIRVEGLWHVSYLPPSGVDATLQEAVAAVADAADSPELSFLKTLVARKLGAPASDLAAAFDSAYASRSPAHPFSPWSDLGHLASLLQPPEERALARALLGSEASGSGTELRLATVAARGWHPPAAKDAGNLLRTAELPPGLAQDVMRLMSCSPRDTPMYGARIRFGADGRPSRTELIAFDQPDAPCPRAARALLLASLEPLERTAAEAAKPVLFALPLRTATAECPASPPAADTTSSSEKSRRVGGRIKEPRKIKDVKPVYPERAKRAGIDGVVVLEATISTSGCVEGARLTNAAELVLAWEALRAVIQWRYTPTLLDGRPVPVLMTVTVNFRLGTGG